MRLLITGSRQWTDRGALEELLWSYWLDGDGPLTIVHGDCSRGADRMAREWAERVNPAAIQDIGGPVCTEERHPADWDRYGRAAGPRRNAEMVALGADLCLAFIVLCKSPGTEHTVKLARKAGIPVKEVLSIV